PDPALVLHLIESIRSCCARSRMLSIVMVCTVMAVNLPDSTRLNHVSQANPPYVMARNGFDQSRVRSRFRGKRAGHIFAVLSDTVCRSSYRKKLPGALPPRWDVQRPFPAGMRALHVIGCLWTF